MHPLDSVHASAYNQKGRKAHTINAGFPLRNKKHFPKDRKVSKSMLSLTYDE